MWNDTYKKINDFLVRNIVVIIVAVVVCLLNRPVGKVPMESYNRAGVMSAKAPLRRNKVALMESDSAVSFETTGIDLMNREQNRKIIKKFSLVLTVKNIETEKNRVEKGLKELNGYVKNFYLYDYSGYKAINIQIAVPSEKLDDYISYLKENNYVKSENFSAIDQTEQYMDNENRLKNLRIRRDKLREMVLIKTTKLADLLAVDRELNNVQIEIELLEKRNFNIQKSVDYSDIDLVLEPEIIENKENNQWSFRRTVANAVDCVILFYHAVIQYLVIFVLFLPVVIVVMGLLVIIKVIRNKYKK
jgi:hypothetical protein